jgi:hypothetical protein
LAQVGHKYCSESLSAYWLGFWQLVVGLISEGLDSSSDESSGDSSKDNEGE